MKKSVIMATLSMALLAFTASAAVVGDFQLIADTLANGDTNLNVKISNTDLIQGLTGTMTGAGFHGATQPASDTDRLNTLTDGAFSNAALTVIAADTDASSAPSCVIEYTITAADVWEIVAFSGHDGDGARTFINIQVEVNTGSGFAPLGGSDLITGNYGDSPTAASVAYARIYNDAGAPLASGVVGIRFTVQNVSHNSNGLFKKWDDSAVPGFPNQGTILKEIDVKTAPSNVADWTQY